MLMIVGIPLLSGASLVVAQNRSRVTVPREIVRQLVNYGEDAAELRAEAIDLNHDGRTELIVWRDCTLTRNCSTWIFSKRKGRYQPLLNDEAQLVTTGSVVTQGYRDLVFKVHGSAYESNFLTYKFDGEQYHVMECLHRDYSYIDREGRFHIRKHPKITRC